MSPKSYVAVRQLTGGFERLLGFDNSEEMQLNILPAAISAFKKLAQTDGVQEAKNVQAEVAANFHRAFAPFSKVLEGIDIEAELNPPVTQKVRARVMGNSDSYRAHMLISSVTALQLK